MAKSGSTVQNVSNVSKNNFFAKKYSYSNAISVRLHGFKPLVVSRMMVRPEDDSKMIKKLHNIESKVVIKIIYRTFVIKKRQDINITVTSWSVAAKGRPCL